MSHAVGEMDTALPQSEAKLDPLYLPPRASVPPTTLYPGFSADLPQLPLQSVLHYPTPSV